MCFWLFEIACLRLAVKGLGIGPWGISGHHDRVSTLARGERLDLQTGQMESQDCLITLEIYEPQDKLRKVISTAWTAVGEDRFQKANDGRQAQQRGSGAS